MIDIKNNNKKKTISIIVIAIIIIIAGYFLLNKFIFSSEKVKDIINLSDKNNQIDIFKKKIKEINIDIFNDSKFKNLKENKFKLIDINKIKVGKKNPFVKNN